MAFIFDRNGDILAVLHVNETDESQSERNSWGGSIAGKSPKPVEETQSRIEMLVSSRHLILASSVFKAMLQEPRFAEGIELKEKGHASIDLHDDDPKALEIIFNVVHGHPKKVPRYVKLKTLVKIAIIVDKYEMHDNVDHFSELWMKPIYTWQFRTEPILYILSMLCISWVFKDQNLFAEMTLAAQLQLDRRIDEYAGFDATPIPGTLIGKKVPLRTLFIKLTAN